MLDSPVCRCGHTLAVHDPCSLCKCPTFDATKKARKFPARKADR